MQQPKRVVLKEGREKSLTRRHPWVFSGAIATTDDGLQPGDTVRVETRSGRFLAHAAISPASQIRLRVWSFDESEPIDAGFIDQRLRQAVDLRQSLGLLDADGACRLVFSESDRLPGLIVDRYAEHLVCQFLSTGSQRWREAIVDSLGRLLSPRSIYERSDAAARRKEGLPPRRGLLAGSEPAEEVQFDNGSGLSLVDIATGQKTGAYLDQRRNRQRVAAYARGREVLDAYSYTGAFGISTLRHGASQVMLLDSSEDALRMAQRVAVLNEVAERCELLRGGVPEQLRRLRDAGRQFDLVILDPPKFVHSDRQLKSGCRGYKDINMLALGLLRPGGILATFSCSGHVSSDLFQKVLAGAALDAGREVQILERLGQAPDHPVALEFPQAEYLKGLILHVTE